MGWLFRKSVKIFPGIRLNFGKKGPTSATIGKGGWFSTNVSPKGVRHNFNVPGTGIRYQTKPVGPNVEAAPTPGGPHYNYETLNNQITTTWHCDNCQNLNPQQNNYCGICGHTNLNKQQLLQTPVAVVSAKPNSTRNAIFLVMCIATGFVATVTVCVGPGWCEVVQ